MLSKPPEELQKGTFSRYLLAMLPFTTLLPTDRISHDDNEFKGHGPFARTDDRRGKRDVGVNANWEDRDGLIDSSNGLAFFLTRV
jgi:hypothetical protein